jgi:hypothetical protein
VEPEIGEIPVAFVARAKGSDDGLTEDDVKQFVAKEVKNPTRTHACSLAFFPRSSSPFNRECAPGGLLQEGPRGGLRRQDPQGPVGQDTAQGAQEAASTSAPAPAASGVMYLAQ